MPELPEVETVRRTLYDKLIGREVVRVEIRTPRQIYHPDPETFRAEVEGARFTDIERRGKWLIFRMGPNGIMRLVAHLRMSGHLFLCDPELAEGKHLHVVFHLDDGRQLRYEDQRKFGGFHLLGKDGEGMPPGLASSGPEPLGAQFTPAYFHGKLRGKRKIKAALLDQSLVAGLGNIYVDEALFGARIHPEREAGSLTAAEAERLHAAIQDVLERALAKRGTTFSLYLDGDGAAGDFYDDLLVFDRAGEPCRVCGAQIEKLAVAGRGTHVCHACQPAPAYARLEARRPRQGRRGENVLVAAEPPRPYRRRSRKKQDGEV